TMEKKRLIRPGWRRMKKWIRSCFNEEDGQANSQNPDHSESGTCTVYIGDAYKAKRDPEHLPPKNAWQNFGNIIRTIPKFLSSPESAFGLRVALATMTVGIVNFLEPTQTFFVKQRLVWAMIIISKFCLCYLLSCY